MTNVQFNERIARASMAQGATSVIAKALNLLLGVVLARLLYPEDYGLFTMTLVVTSLATVFSNFGFQSYVIQAREITPQTLNTCYTLNVLFSLVLGLAVAGAGTLWPAAPPRLRTMLLLYGIHVFVSGLSYIELAMLKRDLEFARSARAELTYTAVSMSGRVAFAAAGLGALSFPLGDVLGALVRYVIVRSVKSVSVRLTIPRRESREALWFGMHASSVGLASFVANQTDKLLVSVRYPVGAIGLYGFGSNISSLFYNVFVVPQTMVFLAMFARLRDDTKAARQMLATSTRLIFSMALPVNVLLILETERILLAIFTAKWLPAVPLVRVFAIGFLARCMFAGVTGMQMAFGMAGQAARTKWIGAIVFVLMLAGAAVLRLDIVGYAIAYVVADLLTSIYNVHVNASLLQLGWIEYTRNLLPPAAIGSVATLSWLVMRQWFLPAGLWPSLLALCGVWIFTYVVLTAAFNRVVWTSVHAMIARRRGAIA